VPKRGRNRKVEVEPEEYTPEDLEEFYRCENCPGRDKPVKCANMRTDDNTPIKIPGVGCGRIPEEE
jgi:hypothetical protein